MCFLFVWLVGWEFWTVIHFLYQIIPGEFFLTKSLVKFCKFLSIQERFYQYMDRACFIVNKTANLAHWNVSLFIFMKNLGSFLYFCERHKLKILQGVAPTQVEYVTFLTTLICGDWIGFWYRGLEGFSQHIYGIWLP